MNIITRESLMSLEAYAKQRKTAKPQIIAHRRLRTVPLGEHISLQFEDEQTIRRQIQEMLHIEKIFDEEGMQSAIDAYAALVPSGARTMRRPRRCTSFASSSRPRRGPRCVPGRRSSSVANTRTTRRTRRSRRTRWPAWPAI